MATGNLAYLQDPAVIVVDWIGFICLALASFYLFYKLTTFKGPDKEDDYYMGYREDKMLSVFVNLFAAIAYWARICSHANGDVGPAAQVNVYKYLDYLLTCPLLTLDLMWSLNLPYKFTYAGFVFCCIIAAFMCSAMPGNARYMWFGFGICLFGFTWFSIIRVVRIRLDQFVSKEAKKVRAYLKVACMTYFGIWCGYPSLWVIHEAKIISDSASAILHTFLDVLAKSLYGLALLSFVLKGEKSTLIFVSLGKDDDSSDECSVYDEDGNAIGDFDRLPHRPRRESVVIGAKSRHSGTVPRSTVSERGHSTVSERGHSFPQDPAMPIASGPPNQSLFWGRAYAQQHHAPGMPQVNGAPLFPHAGSDNPDYQPSPFTGYEGPRPAQGYHVDHYGSASKMPAPYSEIPPLNREDSRDPNEEEVSKVQSQIRKVEEELASIMSQNRSKRAV